MDVHLSIPSVRPTAELAAEITELAGHLNAANYRWLTLIAEFDRRNGWSDGLSQSCAHWLNWKCGLDMGAAREKVRVAHALENLPKISQAMECGQLSYSKVRALTRIACAEIEELLVMIALHGTAAHVEKLVNVYRRSEPEEISREAKQQATRSLSYQYDEDGSLILKGRLPAEVGALVVKAIDIATGNMFKADLDARVVTNVSAETLANEAKGQCEIEHGPSLAAETARRLACDASIVLLTEDENGQPLNVGRKTRSIPPALRRALNARDKGCRFPGCSNTKFIDAHHIKHWAHGGKTKASNLVTLCRFHHRKVHEGGITMRVLDDGVLRFIQADGSSIESLLPGTTGELGDWHRLPEINTRGGFCIDSNTAVTRWRGESMDYGVVIDSMRFRMRNAQHVSAETSFG